MVKIEIEIPDALWRRMQAKADVDWTEVARRAFDARLEGDRMRAEMHDCPSYGIGYNWARDRAEFRDLVAMVKASDYAAAAAIVRQSKGFRQRDEFGDALHPSDEMWESFVDDAARSTTISRIHDSVRRDLGRDVRHRCVAGRRDPARQWGR